MYKRQGLAAERAARYGSDTDLELIDTIFGKMELAHQKRDPTTEAALDADFHMAIIAASHNVVMLHRMRAMYELLKQGVFYNRQTMFRKRMTRDQLLDQHRAINTALPVSYTHLDVYKRQLLSLGVSDAGAEHALRDQDHPLFAGWNAELERSE